MIIRTPSSFIQQARRSLTHPITLFYGSVESHRMMMFVSRSDVVYGYAVAAFAGVMYDWALTLAQEIELVWRQRWSLMTFLYLSVRYLGILYAVQCSNNLGDRYSESSAPMPAIALQLTAALCRGRILYIAQDLTNVVVFPLLCVIMIARLHAMYQGSRKMLIFLIVIFLADNIFNGVVTAIGLKHTSMEALILSGTYQCMINYADGIPLLNSITWILAIVWEVLAMCLAVWIAVKHFRELRRHSAGGIIEDCFAVLMKFHVIYFASFVAVSCFQIGLLSPTLSTDQFSLGTEIYLGFLQIFTLVQIFVLGPRLILGIREFNARVMTDSDAASTMTSIAFQERVHMSTSSSV
ncbi:hypothetical protein EV702DRAFT_1269580 [Suillus placidus]|uniref:DUF6533 domain-containing protein n=1 Tax=Suillus placidus TaxID=48579 RepID=A0A9P7D1P8_9AGAM|nr:hypothetical protein EV702DRAFT_1269580 [Suillus placidus]